MRKLVIGDIHGGLKALEQLLSTIEIYSTDTLIFLGDYVDGWSQSPQLLDFLIDLKHKYNCIFMRGNHDQLLLDWLEGKHDLIDEVQWYKHGGQATVKSYKGLSQEVIQKHITFLHSLQNYFIDEHKRLYVHAGFTNMHGVTQEYFPKMLYWDRSLWETAIALDPTLERTSNSYPQRLLQYFEIFIGHTPVTRLGYTIPLQKANVWNIDTGAAFKGPLTIINADTKEFWQSEPLYLLYPNERGRN